MRQRVSNDALKTVHVEVHVLHAHRYSTNDETGEIMRGLNRTANADNVVVVVNGIDVSPMILIVSHCTNYTSDNNG
jgi:hypothetical protein